jgi:DNA invertase Pin-like site-specific DNA recombinase
MCPLSLVGHAGVIRALPAQKIAVEVGQVVVVVLVELGKLPRGEAPAAPGALALSRPERSRRGPVSPLQNPTRKSVARVSTDEQARSGYSLAQQLEALREYAAREGYEILEEVVDPGQSGASLERPGMDRVRDLVAAGGVYVVLAQDRDRFAREPAYHYLLRREFEEHEREAKVWLDKLAEADEERRGYQRLAAKGLMTDGELTRALAELEETHETTRRNLESLSRRREKIVELERDKDALLDSYAGMVPEALDSLTPEERHQIYKMLRLRVVASADTKIEATGAFSDASICTPETL